ncbi:hypothetical protein Bca4012_025187 [Brassica carinata]
MAETTGKSKGRAPTALFFNDLYPGLAEKVDGVIQTKRALYKDLTGQSDHSSPCCFQNRPKWLELLFLRWSEHKKKLRNWISEDFGRRYRARFLGMKGSQEKRSKSQKEIEERYIFVYDNNDQSVFVLLGDAGHEITGKHASKLVDKLMVILILTMSVCPTNFDRHYWSNT